MLLQAMILQLKLLYQPSHNLSILSVLNTSSSITTAVLVHKSIEAITSDASCFFTRALNTGGPYELGGAGNPSSLTENLRSFFFISVLFFYGFDQRTQQSTTGTTTNKSPFCFVL